MRHVTIIAEAGQNHNGQLKMAYKLIDAAKKSGADFVKFQTSIPKLHVSKFAKKADYQIIKINIYYCVTVSHQKRFFYNL